MVSELVILQNYRKKVFYFFFIKKIPKRNWLNILIIFMANKQVFFLPRKMRISGREFVGTEK